MILKIFFRKAIMVLFVFLCCLIWSKLVDCYSHSHRMKPQVYNLKFKQQSFKTNRLIS